MESIMDIMGLAWKGDSVARLSSQIHESPTATRKGLESALPLSMAGLASLFSSEQKASELLGTFKGGNFPHVEASEIGKLVSDPAATSQLTQSSSGFLRRIFGSKLDGILDSLAGTSGVSRSSAITLLGLSAPLVLGAIQKESEARALDARGLSRFISDQGQKASGLLPSSLAGILGRSSAAEVVPSHARKVTYTEKAFETHSYDTPAIAPPPLPPRLPAEVRRVEEVVGTPEVVAEPTRRSGGLWWLLLPLALLGLFGLMRMGRQPERAVRPVVTVPHKVAVPEVVTRPQVAEPVAEAPRAPIEATSQRAAEAPAPAAQAPAPAIDTVTARLQPETHVVHFDTSSDVPLNRAQLRQVVAILKAHPSAKVRLRGYADPRGEQAENEALSAARATSVMGYLVSHDIAADRISMVARGTEDPLVTNADTRRVELIIDR